MSDCTKAYTRCSGVSQCQASRTGSDVRIQCRGMEDLGVTRLYLLFMQCAVITARKN